MLIYEVPDPSLLQESLLHCSVIDEFVKVEKRERSESSFDVIDEAELQEASGKFISVLNIDSSYLNDSQLSETKSSPDGHKIAVDDWQRLFAVCD